MNEKGQSQAKLIVVIIVIVVLVLVLFTLGSKGSYILDWMKGLYMNKTAPIPNDLELFRYNTALDGVDVYDGVSWKPMEARSVQANGRIINPGELLEDFQSFYFNPNARKAETISIGSGKLFFDKGDNAFIKKSPNIYSGGPKDGFKAYVLFSKYGEGNINLIMNYDSQLYNYAISGTLSDAPFNLGAVTLSTGLSRVVIIKSSIDDLLKKDNTFAFLLASPPSPSLLVKTLNESSYLNIIIKPTISKASYTCKDKLIQAIFPEPVTLGNGFSLVRENIICNYYDSPITIRYNLFNGSKLTGIYLQGRFEGAFDQNARDPKISELKGVVIYNVYATSSLNPQKASLREDLDGSNSVYVSYAKTWRDQVLKSPASFRFHPLDDKGKPISLPSTQRSCVQRVDNDLVVNLRVTSSGGCS